MTFKYIMSPKGDLNQLSVFRFFTLQILFIFHTKYRNQNLQYKKLILSIKFSQFNLLEAKHFESPDQGDQIETGPMRDKIFQRVPPLFFFKFF
jgi:hypothetical protein